MDVLILLCNVHIQGQEHRHRLRRNMNGVLLMESEENNDTSIVPSSFRSI